MGFRSILRLLFLLHLEKGVAVWMFSAACFILFVLVVVVDYYHKEQLLWFWLRAVSALEEE